MKRPKAITAWRSAYGARATYATLARRARWAGLLCLLACVPPAPELTPLERAGVHAALEGWRAAGLPPLTQERCDFSHVYVRVVPPQDWPARCAAAEAACLGWDESANFFRARKYPVVMLRHNAAVGPDSEPVIHELMHAQYHCAAGLDWMAEDNLRHKDPRVWSAAETDPGTSAQSRARTLVQGL